MNSQGVGPSIFINCFSVGRVLEIMFLSLATRGQATLTQINLITDLVVADTNC